MIINDCHVVSEPSNTPEGWSSTVSKGDVNQGPFSTIASAVACAKEWNNEKKDFGSVRGPTSATEPCAESRSKLLEMMPGHTTVNESLGSSEKPHDS